MAKSIRSKRMKRLRTQKRKTWVKEEQDVRQSQAIAHLKASLAPAAGGATLAGLKAALAGAAATARPRQGVQVHPHPDDAGAGGGLAARAAAVAAAAATKRAEMIAEAERTTAKANAVAAADDEMMLDKGPTTKDQKEAKLARKRRSKRRSFKLYR